MQPEAVSLAFLSDPGLLKAVLDVSLTGISLVRPCHAADSDELVDFTLDYLNPEAQRLLNLPAHPTESLLQLRPKARETGAFNFYRDIFLTQGTGELTAYTPADEPDKSYHVAARRHGEQLLVSFKPIDRTHNALETALQASQASQRGAEANAEQQRQLLQAVLAQAPVGIGLFQGDDLVVTVANEQICSMWGYAPEQVLGFPLLEGIPELRGQGFEQILAEVARTRVPFVGTEVAADLPRNGKLETHYFNFIYQHMFGPDGSVLGVVDVAMDVTEQVVARQQAQKLNADLAAEVAEHAEATLVARAQAELQGRRLERLFMTAPAAIAILGGPDLVFELVNPIYQEQFPGRKLLGRPLEQALPELVGSELLRRMQQAYETGETYHHNHHTTFPVAGPMGPQERCFNSVYKPRLNYKGVIDGLLVFSFEVTEQLRAQQRADALQAQALADAQRHARERETFYQVFEQAPARIALVRGPHHTFTYCNEAYEQLFPGRELRGRTLAEALPEAAEQGFVALLDQVYQRGETYFGYGEAFEMRQPDAQKSATAYFDYTYQPYREHEQVVGVSIFAYDVTEQVLARRQHEALQQQLRELFEQAPLSICLFGGPGFEYELASLQHQALFPDRRLLGRPLLQAVPELAGQPVWETLQRVYHTGETVVELAALVELAPQAGAAPENAYFDYIFQARRSDQGEITGVLVFAFDTTEQVLGRQRLQVLNQELQATNHQLEHINQRLRAANTDLANFVYTASHDLKTPIANIEGLLDMLQDNLPAEARQGMVSTVLELMSKSTTQFQQTITQLADITHLQQDAAQPAEPVDLAALLESIRLDLEPLLAATQAEITLDVAAQPAIRFAPQNLRSILFNLISNAIKYHDPARLPRVHLWAYRSAPAAGSIIEVQDNGLGLTPEQQLRLFGLFRRLHTHVEGSGVGLYMIRKIVENAGGTISVRSQAGIGSTFVVFLPD